MLTNANVAEAVRQAQCRNCSVILPWFGDRQYSRGYGAYGGYGTGYGAGYGGGP